MQHLHLPHVSRRHFLLGTGALAGGIVLGACGGDDDDAANEGSSSSTVGGDAGLSLIAFMQNGVLGVGGESRIPFGVADRDGILPPDEVPASLEVRLLDQERSRTTPTVVAERHSEGLARAYYPLSVEFDAPGIYTLQTEIDGATAELSVQVVPQEELRLVRSGVRMPAIDSPTVDDPRGVTPICTRDPVCPLHDITIAQALAAGEPLAVLVATPAFCQITICGPVLDLLLEVMGGHPEYQFVHAEVYADPATSLSEFSPTVNQLLLPHEPALVLVGADGIVHTRVDVIFDRVEIDDLLTRYAPG